MKKLVCRVCGNEEFKVLHVGETLCKCGLRLTKISDYASEESKMMKEFYVNNKRQAEVISRVSLLRRAIDESLDKRDEEEFKRLTSQLRVCRHYLQRLENKSPNLFQKGIGAETR